MHGTMNLKFIFCLFVGNSAIGTTGMREREMGCKSEPGEFV
jgi:hypothetical protein